MIRLLLSLERLSLDEKEVALMIGPRCGGTMKVLEFKGLRPKGSSGAPRESARIRTDEAAFNGHPKV
jgi:hypothetical protein